MSLPYLQNNWGLSNGLQTMNASAGGSVGGWVELGRTTLGSANATISVTGLSNKRYYMAVVNGLGASVPINPYWRCNTDSGSNYATRNSENGGADGTTTSTTSARLYGVGSATHWFGNSYFSNLSGNEKLIQGHTVCGLGTSSGTAPVRGENTAKWANTSSSISSIQCYTGTADTFDTGSELVILGWDPADTHTTNFWEEIATDTGDGSSTDITCTFTAKKYLWIQAYIEGSSSIAQSFRLGSSSTPDSGSNYAYRYSRNGGADSTAGSQTSMLGAWNEATNRQLWNFFIINNASNEKLILAHQVVTGTAGAGTAPDRSEWACKWVNTSNQADVFEINRASGNWSTASVVKVWGSD